MKDTTLSIGKMKLSEEWSLISRGSQVLGEDRQKSLGSMVECYRCSQEEGGWLSLGAATPESSRRSSARGVLSGTRTSGSVSEGK